ncbi:ribonuclease III [Trypanosoma rangeli]|uniref:Ribonuclease III n=1 Tax=Trypanosoma rangeli TaxID=5698 RepID=A0A3R7LCP5_TRYRA|nr:ribonuclease III [Trypanosoma rangeli]RNF11757.1 ribonuclease III [Trypanosoma rangeli]|eukprot:RNF11757.1 ribonuclease III [Trypanosoma rangeli]
MTVLSFTRCPRNSKELKQGWFPATDILQHLQRNYYGWVKSNDRAAAEHTEAWMPTTPEQLVSLLLRLNALRQLQFCWDSGAKVAPAKTAGHAWVRATWAHCSRRIAEEVLESHPLLPLEQVLSQFSSVVEFYDYIDHVDLWQSQVRNHGGRTVPDFRPFLKLVPVSLFCRGDERGDGMAWDTALVATKINSNSAFVRVSKTFIDLHREKMVRVVHPQPYCSAASESPEEGVLLLLLSEMNSDVITRSTEGMTYIRAEVLYGDGVSTEITVEALRLLNQKEGEGSTCAANKERGDIGCSSSGGAQLCRFTRQLIQLCGQVRVAELSSNADIKKNTENNKDNGLTPQPFIYFDAAAARRCLRFVAAEATSAFAALGEFDLGVVCSRWLAVGSSLLSCHANEKNLAATFSAVDAFAALSLILPRMRCSDGAVPYGWQVATKELRIEVRAGAFVPLHVSSQRQKHPFTVYFAQRTPADVNDGASLATTPMVLLRPQRTTDVRRTAPVSASDEEATPRPRAALVLSYISLQDDEYEDGAVLIAMELSEEDEAQCRGDRDDGDIHPDEDNRSDGGGGALLWSTVIVDEWELETVAPIAEIVEREFMLPLERSLRTSNMACCFRNFPVEVQDALLQSMRSQLLLAVTPEQNETLEYLGDAILDFVVAQDKLSTWTAGPIVSESSNKHLAPHLPEVIARHLRLLCNISNEKRKADVVEALFGAVVMALWVVPYSGVAKGPVSAAGCLPFTCVLEVVRGLMDVLHIVVA